MMSDVAAFAVYNLGGGPTVLCLRGISKAAYYRPLVVKKTPGINKG